MILTGLAPGAASEDLLIARLTGEKRLDTLLQAPGVERHPAIASSGRFVAYNSNESGRPEVYVRPFPDLGTRRWQVSAEGGAFPVWTRSGREIVYVAGEGRIMAVAVRPHGIGAADFSTPEPLFTFGEGMGQGLDRDFDVTNDGERFVFLLESAAASESTAELVLIQNWVQELKRLVPQEP